MKVDVCINVYGKPWQTLCTLKTLMSHSGQHIDKIYFIKEREQLYNDDVDWILHHFDNLVVYTPAEYHFAIRQHSGNREYVRYQYGFDNSNKKYIYITHNDVLYTGDIIGNMLSRIGDAVGIGQIGQCWNCPAFHKSVCSGDKYDEWNPTYDDVISLGPLYRTQLHMISRDNPKLMPECRLNEWTCLIDREASNKETANGTPYFGTYDDLDIGSAWFRSMVIKGYRFVDHRVDYEHGYWAPGVGGYKMHFSKEMYDDAELKAKHYYETVLTK